MSDVVLVVAGIALALLADWATSPSTWQRWRARRRARAIAEHRRSRPPTKAEHLRRAIDELRANQLAAFQRGRLDLGAYYDPRIAKLEQELAAVEGTCDRTRG